MAHLAIRLTGALRFGEVVGDLALDEGRLVAVALPGPLDGEPGEEALAQLDPGERAAAAAMLPRRQRTFVGGRLALRRALAGTGAAGAAVPSIVADDRGAPGLPVGLRGSIAHKDDVAVALAAEAAGWALGVDVEPMRPLSWGLARRIATPEERAVMEAVGDDDARGRALLRCFAVKEAVYKAIDPFLRRWVGFLEVIVHEDAGALVIEPRLAAGEPDLLVEARCLDAGDLLLAVARARPR